MSSETILIHPSGVNFTDHYDLQQELGRGAFSIVHRAVKKDTGDVRAVKVMQIKPTEKDKLLLVEKEIAIMKRVIHANTVRLYEVFHNADTYYLVMQIITGGELFERIVSMETYSEAYASRVLLQLLSALEHCHSHHVAHFDLKPENLLLSSADFDSDVILSDFGLSEILEDGKRMFKAVGTPGYLAPEVLATLDTKCGYDYRADLFSVGVIAYILLSGMVPFFGEDEEEVFVKTETLDYSFPSPYWDSVSAAAKDLIQHLLTLDAESRYTTQQALNHPWIKRWNNNSQMHLGDTIVQLKKFNARRKFRGAVRGLIAVNKLSRKAVLLAAANAEATGDTLKTSDGASDAAAPTAAPTQ